MRQAIVISFCLSLVLSIVGFIFAQEVVTFAGAQSDTVADATIYFRILLTGMVFTAVTLTINAAQRGAGNTKISMKTNVTANIVNVIFNYLLIGGNLGFPRWGVAGAAVATTLGNFVALCMAIRSITSKPVSYTHLDVYKRQVIGNRLIFVFKGEGVKAGLQLFDQGKGAVAVP